MEPTDLTPLLGNSAGFSLLLAELMIGTIITTLVSVYPSGFSLLLAELMIGTPKEYEIGRAHV